MYLSTSIECKGVKGLCALCFSFQAVVQDRTSGVIQRNSEVPAHTCSDVLLHSSPFHNLNQNILEWLTLNSHDSKIQWPVQCNQQENQLDWGKWRIAAEQPLHLRDRESSGFIFISTSDLFWKYTFSISDVMYQLNWTLCEIQKENFLFSNNISGTVKQILGGYRMEMEGKCIAFHNFIYVNTLLCLILLI